MQIKPSDRFRHHHCCSHWQLAVVDRVVVAMGHLLALAEAVVGDLRLLLALALVAPVLAWQRRVNPKINTSNKHTQTDIVQFSKELSGFFLPDV